jgi:hypothetical protein
MNQTSYTKNALIDKTISQRSGIGPNDLVRGWQSMLSNLLNDLRSYLKPSKIVTFRHLTSSEKEMFEKIVQRVAVPDSAYGIFISASARNQMMYTNQGFEVPAEASAPKDDGVLLFSRPSSHQTIINALLAHHPHTPAIDIYDDGALLAGYVYESIDDCIGALTEVVDTYLGGQHSAPDNGIAKRYQ